MFARHCKLSLSIRIQQICTYIPRCVDAPTSFMYAYKGFCNRGSDAKSAGVSTEHIKSLLCSPVIHGAVKEIVCCMLG